MSVAAADRDTRRIKKVPGGTVTWRRGDLLGTKYRDKLKGFP
jgi:hypothetical protein